MKRDSRISYDKHFWVKHKENAEYLGKEIDGLSLWFKYRYYMKHPGTHEEIEVLFPHDGSIQPECFYTCSYDKNTGYIMKLNEKHLNNSIFSRVEYEAEEASVWFLDKNDPIVISIEDAIDIIKSHPNAFDCNDNEKTQNLAYSMTKVKDI